MSNQSDPFLRLEALLSQAREAGIQNANAMVLSTVDDKGQPSSRQVLLKGLDQRGLVFYTNLKSRKGRELSANSRCSLNFYWRELDQQVTIQGLAELVSDQEADEYFQSRPRVSRLGAWASKQSEVLSSNARLLAEVAKVELRYPRTIPRPPHWSGYRVAPFLFDFWTAREFRLHDRICYRLVDGGWETFRLYP